MKVYSNGQGQQWLTAKVDQTVLDYINTNPGKNETEIATGTSLSVDQVMWALGELTYQGKIALVPESWSDFNDHPHHGGGRG